MTPDDKTKIDWRNKFANAFSNGVSYGVLFIMLIGISAIAKGCLDSNRVQDMMKLQLQESKIKDEEVKRNAPCQDIIYQLGSQPEGKIVCHKDAETIVNHAVVECRCKKP